MKPGENLNIKNINKYIPNMNQGHQIISPQNINIKLSSSNSNLKFNNRERERDAPEENKI